MSWSASASQQLKLRRYSRPVAISLALLVCIWYFLLPSSSAPTTSPRAVRKSTRTNSRFLTTATATHPKPQSPGAFDFWRAFTDALDKLKPSFPEIEKKSDHSPWVFFDRVKQDSTRPELLELPKEQLDELKRLRKEAISEFGHLASQLPFNRGTRGIITTAANDALPILTTSLWMLRASGSTLPVEIWFFNRKDMEEEPCNDIFPSFGARCVVMEDYIPKDMTHAVPLAVDNKFIYKPLAMALSTFEQALFLDSDAFPVMNPDSIFETEPFKSNGFVLWPDYWASTVSPFFYNITGRRMPDLKEMATAESGQLLFNKASHSAPLLLSLWYNIYGPSHWWRLISQHAPGEGDKDTYLPAIQDYKLPWYQVYEPPQRIGYGCNELKHPVGSTQSHPLDDFKLSSNGILRHAGKLDLGEAYHPRALFVHANLPKLDPYLMLSWDMPSLEWQDMLRCDKGQGEAHRLWGPRDLAIAKYGWDVEHQLWDAMRWEACEHETGYTVWTQGSIWRPTETIRHDLCVEMTRFWNELFPDETFVPSPPRIGEREERPWGGWPHPDVF